MMKRYSVWQRLLLVVSVGLLSVTATAEHSEADALAALKVEIAKLSVQSEGEVGVAVELLGTDHKFSVNGDTTYPMASTYKVAMAAYAFHLIDQGKLSLDQMVPVESRNIAYPGQPISTHFIHPGVSLSLYNHIELTLTQSDNTATDVLLETVGGPQAVTAWLRVNGIKELRVDRSTAGVIRGLMGVPAPEDPNLSPKDHAIQVFASLSDEDAAEQMENAYASFVKDPRDQTTPAAMNQLLRAIWQGELLSEDSTEKLQAIMERCITGKDRLKGQLPEGTVVAHKTGTGGGSLNDVGVINLPDGQQVVISVFVKNSKNPDWSVREKAIADISRAVYDYYLASGVKS